MNHQQRRFVSSFALLFTVALPAAAGVPDAIKSPYPSARTPIWVTAEKAIVDGQIRWDLFDRSQQFLLKPTLATARAATERAGRSIEASTSDETGCTTWTVSNSEPVLRDYSLQNLYGYADLVFVGTVTDERQGFYNGQAATLYEIAIDRLLKAPPDTPHLRSIYLIHSYAVLKVGRDLVCERDVRYPAKPSPGGRILVFTSTIIGGQPSLVDAPDDGLFFEQPSEAVSLPARFEGIIDASDWETLVEQASRLARDPKTRPVAGRDEQKP